jgi:hypothetical protein
LLNDRSAKSRFGRVPGEEILQAFW